MLAQFDQQVAEAEALAAEPVLSYDEEELVAIQLASCRHGQKHAERLLRTLGAQS